MKKDRQLGWKLLYLITALVFLANLCCIVYDDVSFSIDVLPQGELLYSLDSPNGARRLSVYRVENVFGCAVRAEASENGGEPVNIYWQTGISDQRFAWINDALLEFDHTTLDLAQREYYDCRFDQSLLREGRIRGNKSKRK